MSRGFGEIGVIKQLPDALVVIAGLITQLGDMWFVVLGILGLYWIGTRDASLTTTPKRDCLYLFALGLGAYALTLSLKHVFALPRPPGATMAVLPAWLPTSNELVRTLEAGDGFGFPSGHALKSTVVYGGAALVFTNLDDRKYFVSAAIVSAVGLSRIVLGVHYLVDVLAGILIGVVFLVGMNRVTKMDPRRAFTVSGLLGLVAAGLSMAYTSGLVIVAAGLGLGSWEFSRRGRE